MELQLFDTYERRVRPFTPLTPHQVGMYCCGPTVYNFAHIGNLRTYLFEDVLRRVLQLNGYRVKLVMNITDAQADYVREVTQTLVQQGFRVEADLRNEKIGYKIREHTLQKIPYLFVVGDREKELGLVAVRARSGEDLGSMSLADLAERLRAENGPVPAAGA